MNQDIIYRTAFFNRNDGSLYPPEILRDSYTKSKSWYDFLGTMYIKNHEALNTLNNLSFKRQDLTQDQNYFLHAVRETETPPKDEKSDSKIWPIILLIIAALAIALLLALFINNYAKTKIDGSQTAENTEILTNSEEESSPTSEYSEGVAENENSSIAGPALESKNDDLNNSNSSITTNSGTTSSSQTERNKKRNAVDPFSHADGLIMVGAFTEQPNINELVNKLESQGYDVYMRNPNEWITYVGVYADPGDYETLNWIRSNIAPDAWFTK